MEAIREGLIKGCLPPSMCNARNKLIPKKGDISNFENWRNISILTVFYKTLSKVMADRLQPVLTKLVGNQQFAYRRDRGAHDAIMNVLDHAHSLKLNNTGLEGIFSIDFKNAFDCIDHQYIVDCLQAYNFGEYFCNMVKVALNNRTGTIYDENMQNIGLYNINVGVLQGDIVAPYLFLIAISPLLTKLCSVMVGKHLEKHHPVISFADDVTIMGKLTSETIDNIIDVCDTFKKLSGLSINFKKSSLMYLKHTTSESIRGIPLSSEIKLLGFHLNNTLKITADNWQATLSKLTKQICNWSRFNLTLKGRLRIASTFMLSQINYMARILPTNNPAFNAIVEKIHRFITRNSNISQSLVTVPTSARGLGFVDLHSAAAAMRAHFICSALGKNQEKWACNINNLTDKYYRINIMGHQQLTNLTRDFLVKLPNYKQAFYNQTQSWIHLPVTSPDLLKLSKNPKKTSEILLKLSSYEREQTIALLLASKRSEEDNPTQSKKNDHLHHLLQLFPEVDNNKTIPRADFMQFIMQQKKSKNLRIILQSHTTAITVKKQESKIADWYSSWGLTCEITQTDSLKVWKSESLSNNTSEFIYNFFSNRLISNHRRAKFDTSIVNKCLNCDSINGESETLKHLFFECTLAQKLWAETFGFINPMEIVLLLAPSAIKKSALIMCQAIWKTRMINARAIIKPKITKCIFKTLIEQNLIVKYNKYMAMLLKKI